VRVAALFAAFLAVPIADGGLRNREKGQWPHSRDVQYGAEWPMRQPARLFGGLAFNNDAYLDIWKTLRPDSDVDEVIRNFFIRRPLLWPD
jgi:hypothetical protein